MKVSEVRLTWEESQEHYHAIHDIEERHSLQYYKGKVSNALKKKSEAKIHNDTNAYLREKQLIYKLGGFYKTVISSND